jgi:hypothetical protein
MARAPFDSKGNRFVKRAVSLFALAILMTGGSCDENDPCDDVACFSRFSLYLHFDLDGVDTYPPGNYSLDVVVDGESSTCNFAIPEDRTAHYDCAGREILAGPDLVFVTFPGTPAEVQVTLSIDGSAMFTDTYVPDYETISPNGPDCPSTCEAASADAYVLP